ncbi:Uncharacterised protein [Vibrio cholerae]|nr:Uncharacterised protein [Vibrio cholerae]
MRIDQPRCAAQPLGYRASAPEWCPLGEFELQSDRGVIVDFLHLTLA